MSIRRISIASILFLLVALLVAVAGALALQHETEPNNDQASADEINLGELLHGDLYKSYGWGRDVVDVFKFRVASGYGIDILYSQLPGSTLKIHLVDERTMTDRWNARMSTTMTEKEFWTAAETPSGYWGIVVEIDDPRPQVTDYRFNVSLVPPNDADTGKDAPDSTGTPLSVNLTMNQWVHVKGHLGDLDVRDCYHIQMGNGETLRTYFSSQASSAQTLRLLDSYFNELRRTASQDDETEFMFFSTANETPVDSDFYIYIEGPSTAVGYYELDLLLGRQNDLQLHKDAGGTKAGAEVLEGRFFQTGVGDTRFGLLADLDDSDVFKFLAEQGMVYNLYIYTSSEEIEVEVEDDEANIIWTSDDYPDDEWVHTVTICTAEEAPEESLFLSIRIPDAMGVYGTYYMMARKSDATDYGLGKDAGGDMGSADEITPNGRGDRSCSRSRVGTLDASDMYTFEAGVGDIIEFGLDYFIPSTERTTAKLIDSDGNVLRTVDEPESWAMFVTAHETELQPWYIKVETENTGVTDYCLFICVYKQWEGIDEYGDAPRSIATAEPINVDHTYPGIVADLDMNDEYTFEAGGGKIIEVTFESNVFGGMGLDLMFSKADDVGLRSLRANVQTGPQSFQYYTDKDTPIQDWYVMINTSKFIIPVEDDPTYELTVRLLDQNDGYMDDDAGSSEGSAMEKTLISHGPVYRFRSWRGVVADEDGADIYWFEAGNGEMIYISCSNLIPYEYVDFTLYDSEGNVIENPRVITMLHSDGYQSERLYRYITAKDTPMQSFYLEITPQGGSDHTEYAVATQTMMQYDGHPAAEEYADAPVGIDESQPISTDSAYYLGVLGDLDYRDCFSFPYGQGQVISIGFNVTDEEDAQAGQVLSFRNPSNETMFEIVGEPGVEVWDTFISSRETPLEDWYIFVEFTDPGSFRNDTQYYFKIVLQDQGESDISPGTDGPSNNDEAKSTHYMDGVLEDLDVQDNYRFEAGGGQIIRIYFVPGPFEACGTVEPWNGWRYIAGYNVTWKLLDKDGATIYSFDEGVETTFEYITAYETPMQWWYLVVEGDGRYRFFVTTHYQNDAASGRDAAASIDHAVNPPMSIPTRGIMGDLDTMDIYRVMVMPNWNLTVDVTKEQDACMTVSVVSQAGDQVGTLIVPYGETNAFGKFLIPADTPSDAFWYLKFMVGSDWWGEYGFEVGFEPRGNPEAPDIEYNPPSPVYNETEGLVITVSVTDPDGVESVTIFYHLEGETDWKSMEMTADGDVWTVTIPPDDLESGKRLLYYIVAEDSLGNEQQYGSVTNPLNLELETLPTAKSEDSKLDMVFGLVVGILAGVLLGLLVARSRSQG